MVGLFMLGDSILDWELFFFSNRKDFFIKIIGRTAVRIIYGLLGIAALVYGIINVIYEIFYSPF
jgi:uncharacterized membrane protein YuzA (DUF378 family)